MSAPEVLIVDDDPRNCELLGRLLEIEGCRVQTASNAESGIALAIRSPPALILLDIRMPGIDGFEACRRLREMAAFAATPIFLVTAYDDDDVWPEATRSGASGLLGKPYDRPELRRLVQAIAAGASPNRSGEG